MKKNKLIVLTLTALITFGSTTRLALATIVPDVSKDNSEQEVIISEYYNVLRQLQFN